MQKQDLQSPGKGLGGENGAPLGNRNDAFRQHLRGMYAGGSGRRGVRIGTMWDFALSVAPLPRPGFLWLPPLISKCKPGLFTVTTQPSHFRPHPPPPIFLVQTDEDGRAVRAAGTSSRNYLSHPLLRFLQRSHLFDSGMPPRATTHVTLN